MAGRVIIYREVGGVNYEVDGEPVEKVNVAEISREMGLPGYLDLNNSATRRAVVSIWFSTTYSPELNVATGLKVKSPVIPLLFGGGAVKMLSPSANIGGSPLNRRLGDLDFVTRKRDGAKFVEMLTGMHKVAGSRYYHFLTTGDRRFNALRSGERYRVRAVDWDEAGGPYLSSVDVVEERIRMRHTVEVKEEFEGYRENYFTIGMEKMLVTKLQAIADIRVADLEALEKGGQSFRLLRYDRLSGDRVAIGMEEKDLLDVCALLLDGADEIPKIVEGLSEILRPDQRLTLTVRLNLEMILSNLDFLTRRGLTERQVSKIGEGAERLLKAIPEVKKKWNKPWWNVDVDTPTLS